MQESLYFTAMKKSGSKKNLDCLVFQYMHDSGAEVCELAGYRILYELSEILEKMDLGMHRGNGLSVSKIEMEPKPKRSRNTLVIFSK